jgi:TP901-1 family phage major tail protein
MTAQKGSLMLLKIADEDNLGHFNVIGGMRTNRMVFNNEMIDTTNKMSGGWRELLNQSGARSISISGAGIFTDSSSEQKIREYSFANMIKKYQLCFGNGDILQGKFQISSYERSGGYNEEETYNITLESSGEISYSNIKDKD